jgi:hypothetical protein
MAATPYPAADISGVLGKAVADCSVQADRCSNRHGLGAVGQKCPCGEQGKRSGCGKHYPAHRFLHKH